jgi:trk system potassium uptake protein TrkH
MLLTGLLTGVPLFVLPFYPEDAKYALAFLLPMLLSAVLGFAVCAATYKMKEDAPKEWQSPLRRGSVTILFAWCYGFLLGALPFVIGGELSFVHALFESVSGWTTTGLSVIAYISRTPKIFLFHRSFMQYCGGLGFILMMVMIVQGKHAMTLYNAEGHSDRLVPNLRQTARAIFAIYGVFTLLGVLFYRVFGMPVFDAICHTMSALSTAGFTTQVNSIGEYASLPIELVTILLMLIGASNLALLFLLTERKVGRIFRATEMRFMLGLMAVFVPLSAVSLVLENGMRIGEGLRHALFGVVTVFSTTGYSIMNYATWSPFATGLLILLMIIGGGAGSTAGGIKLLRTYFLLRITRENIKKRLSPAIQTAAPTYNAVRGKAPVDSALIEDTFGFITCYMGVFIVGTLLMTLTADCSLMDAAFEFASAFGTVGITNGMTGAHTNTPTLIVEMIGMTLGRLEVLVVFFGLSSGVQMIVGGHTARRRRDD